MQRLTILGLTLTCACLAALAEPSIDQEQELRTAYVTPHTVWARPYAQGTTRVLFISDSRFCMAREMVELMQRFDLTAEAAYFTRIVDTTNDQWHGGEAGLERIRALLDKPWDVYLFNDTAITLLPAEMQYKILDPVTRGAGLVFVGKGDKRVLKTKLPAEPGGPEAELFAVKQGRAALLPAPPRIAYRFGWEAEYDVWQERLGRTVLWAANKLPLVRPQLTVGATVDRAALPAVVAKVRQAGQNPRWRLRRIDDGLVVLLAAESNGAELELPASKLPAGQWRVELWVGDPTIESWAAAPFEVTCQRQVAVTLDQSWGEVGDTLAGRASLSGQALPGEQVVVRLSDRRGRVLASTSKVTPDGATVPFTFKIEPWFPMLVQVQAVVSDDDGPACDAEVYANVTKRRRGQFNFLVWDIPAGPTGHFAEAKLAELGMTLQLNGSAPPPQVAAYDVAYVPYTTRIMDDKDATGQIKPVPWNQEPEIDAWVDSIVSKRQADRQHGTFVYSLGDETVTRGSDTSPSDLAAYQRFLQTQYGDVAKLNASWGTQFKAFGDVALLDPKEPRELAAKQAGNYPRWYDRQAWECANFVGLCERFVKRYKQLDPDALTGFEGAGRFDRGDDIDGIVGTNGFWSPYPGPVDLVIEGIAPREFPRANWMGYVKDGPPLIWKYWRMVLNGCDSVWWWRWDGIGRFNGILRPDLSEFDAFRELWDDTRITREGLGDLLLRCERQHDGVAMLYSMPSVYAAQVADGPSYGSYQSAHEAWHRQLANAGLNFRYLTDGLLKRGEFDPNSAKVLILSRAEALSDAEAKEIRDFVNHGGTVIADLRPGLYDEHLKLRAAGALDDVFGIDTAGAAAAATGQAAELSFDPLPVGRPRTMLKAGRQTVDPGLKAKGAMALGHAGESPVLLDHSYGQGRAILLNLAPELTDDFSGDMPGRFVGQLLAAAGVQPMVTLERQPGAGVPPDLRLVRWTNGSDAIVAVQSQSKSGAPLPVRLRLDARQRVVDVRTGRELGTVDALELSCPPGSAQVLALPAGGPDELQVALSSAGASPGTVVKLNVTAPGAQGDRAALLTATRPDGTNADWLRQVVIIPRGGAGVVDVPVALNDPAGEWKLTVKELYRQRSTTVTLAVR